MIHGLDAEKKAARATLRSLWRALTPESLAALSAQICTRLLETPDWANARSVMLYASISGEIGTSALAEAALKAGKIVSVPRTDWSGGALQPVRIEDWKLADAGARSPERAALPVPHESAPPLAPSSLDLVIVPGLGFDASGNRLGRGAGFYDRFLLENSLGAKSVGLAPRRMILQRIPAGAMDSPVSTIVTESGVIRAAASLENGGGVGAAVGGGAS